MITAEIEPILCHKSGATKLFVRFRTGPDSTFSIKLPISMEHYGQIIPPFWTAYNRLTTPVATIEVK